jgi:hypothetical protein
MENLDNIKITGPNDMLDVEGFLEERKKINDRVINNDDYKKQTDTNITDWKKIIVDKFPEYEGNPEAIELLESAIYSLSFLGYFVQNELKTVDAPLLQNRNPDSENPLFREGIEDLREKFLAGDFRMAEEHVTTAVRLMDNNAFSAKHNIHLGLVPLYMIRERALTLGNNLRWLERYRKTSGL